MGTLTAKSKKALLVFLSVITLTLVLTATLPTRFYKTKSASSDIVSQVIVRRELRRVLPFTLSVAAIAVSTLVALPQLRPWTGATHPRAPPV